MIARGTRVRSKSELVSLLKRWYRGTIELTIGKVGAFGRTPWIHIDLESGRAVLNADTTRDAVGDYLSDAAERGAEAPWWIVRNRDGRIIAQDQGRSNFCIDVSVQPLKDTGTAAGAVPVGPNVRASTSHGIRSSRGC